MEKQELFKILVVPHLPSIKTLVWYYTNNKANVEDNYQEVCLALYRNVERLDASNNIKAYIHVTIRHFCQKSNIPRPTFPVSPYEPIGNFTFKGILSDFTALLELRQTIILSLKLKGYGVKKICCLLHIGFSTYKVEMKKIEVAYKKYINYENQYGRNELLFST